MEICILKFDSSHAAEDALKEVLDAQGDRNPWLHDVAVVARPLIGRVRIGATYPDGKSSTFHEGDLADAVADLGAYSGYFVSLLAGPMGSLYRVMNASMAGDALGHEAERKLFHFDEIKKTLKRDTSALVLIAETKTCDQLVQLFKSYRPQVIRKQVADELRKRLETVHQQLVREMAAEEAEGAPATH
jgi:uncharacterized membrane protein